MNTNELEMKNRGEAKVWKTIKTKTDNYKNVSSTQIGQQLLLEEALEILPQVRDWIDNGSANVYRAELQAYFENDDILLEKLLQSFLFLSGAIYESINSHKSKANKSRHKKIKTIQSKIMPELSFDQCWRFIEVSIDLSNYFEVDSVLHYTDGCHKSAFKWNLKYTCNLSEVIMSKLAVEAAKAFYPLPMTEKPLDWKLEEIETVTEHGLIMVENKLVGGYRDYQYELVRAKPRKVDYSLYSKQIFDAVNYIQSTPWIVNTAVLRQVKSDLKVPKKLDFIKTLYPDPNPSKWSYDIEENKDKLSEYQIDELKLERKRFHELVSLHNADKADFESAIGKYRAIKLAIRIADEYQHETLFFPHSYDFRGRIYPLPIGLSPQGSDAVKALLLYKNTETLTDVGIAWNWAYLASLYGEDKLHFEERIEKGKELINADYKDADEPYQFLSHQLELIKWVSDPSYIPNTRIHLDACNSGSQFTSAITGDKAGCLATNVIPTFDENQIQNRQDAYQLVSDKALELILSRIRNESDAEELEALEFLKDLLVKDGRKICKVPVMVSNYGGTAGGRADILWDMFRELGVERKWITKRMAVKFAGIIGDSITGVLNGGKAFEGYIHQMNNVIARGNKAVQWMTDDGFHVVHIKNKELKARQVSCTLPGARKQTTITKKSYSDKVSSTKMKSAISPNYIHSLDAELLRRVALKMKKKGIEDSDWIHDSFGCHPNHVDLMLELTKDEFRKLTRRQPLKSLDNQLRAQAPDTKQATKALNSISIPSLRGFNAQEGGLDIVMESDWFFS